MKNVRHNQNGTITVEYAHPAACLEGVLEQLRAKASFKIAQVAPIHDQLNAALGLLDSKDTNDLKTAITAERVKFSTAKAQARAAYDSWDGRDATKNSASEAILAALML
jgi:hypothetical protein